MTTEQDCTMLDYFWNEKGDIHRWLGYPKWKADNPEEAAKLESLIKDLYLAKLAIGMYIDNLFPTDSNE